MFKKVILATFFVLAVGLAKTQAANVAWDRALYWDDRYPTAWAGGAVTIRDALQAAGYTTLNADQLKTWMNGHIADQKLSVVVFCRDSVPNTVAETMAATCTLRKYLDAGGKIVWYSDWPLYYQGSADGSQVTWGSSGASTILGFNASSGPNDTYDTVVFTDAGIAWGLTVPWQSQRPTSPTITSNLTVLATISSGSAAAWVKHFVPGDNYRGFVRLYDTTGIPPSVDDIMRVAEYAATQASGPSPADGAVLSQTWVSMTWAPGAFAVSHDVYLGDIFEDVNAGTGNTFQGNQAQASFVAGFAGVPYPDGLVPGTTYYWRIDEVDPTNTYRGPVWRFTVPPRAAYAPTPANGARYVMTDATLSWLPGLNAKLHFVYFGDNFDTVSNAAAGAPRGTTSYTPTTPMVKGKTYYWRVDEFDGAVTHKGDVWSFTTLPDIALADPTLIGWWKFDEGQGTSAVDFSGHGNHGKFNGDPEWVEGYDGGALSFDGRGDWLDCGTDPSLRMTNAVTMTAWVKLGATGIDYKVGGNQNNSNGGYKMGIYSTSKVEFEIRTSSNSPVLNRDVAGGTVLQPGIWYHVAGVYSQQSGYIRTYVNGVLDREMLTPEILGASQGSFKIGCEPYTTSSSNFNGVIDDLRLYSKALTADELQVAMRGDLTRAWKPSPANASISDVARAASLTWSRGDKASQHDVYFGLDKVAVASAGASDTTGIYRGRQTTASYTPPEGVQFNGGPYYWRVDEVNTDGTVTPGTLWSFSVAGYVLVEDFESYNDIAAGQAGSNLVYMTWLDGYGTTTNGSTMGYPTGASLETANMHGGTKAAPFIYNNIAATLSEVERTLPAQNWTANGIQTLSLWFRGDATSVPGQLYVKINGVKVAYDGDAGNLKREAWQTWNITLAPVGTNLQSVTRLTIGIETKGATGTLLLDDIRLYPNARQLITPVQPSAASLIGHWTFDGNTQDSSGLGNNGTPGGAPTFAAGTVGSGAINLNGSDYVAIDGVVSDITSTNITLAAWIKTTQTTEGDIFACNDSASSHPLIFGVTNGNVWVEDNVSTEFVPVNDDQWHFIAYVRNGDTGYIYLDGIQVGTDPANFSFGSVTRWSIGQEWDNATPSDFYIGAVDDARIYNSPLSQAEVAGLAGMTKPFDKPF